MCEILHAAVKSLRRGFRVRSARTYRTGPRTLSENHHSHFSSHRQTSIQKDISRTRVTNKSQPNSRNNASFISSIFVIGVESWMAVLVANPRRQRKLLATTMKRYVPVHMHFGIVAADGRCETKCVPTKDDG